MAQTMKRVVKIEGPFTQKDVLVDSLVPGESYYYRGTNILPLEEVDLLTMKWAYKIDNGKITPFLKTKTSRSENYNKLSGSLPKDINATEITVYAYFNKPSDDVSIRMSVAKPTKPAAPATGATPVKSVTPETAMQKGILEEMKELVDRNIPYSQTGERASLQPEGLKNLDCSETVGIFLHKLGVMPKLVKIDTSLMINETHFRNAIGTANIDFLAGSDKPTFKPQRGDIFVWRKGVGHTGIVYDYNPAADLVTILEAIGDIGSADEATNRNNGGEAKKGCSRTAVYKRAGKALAAHGGWIGYYRPKNVTRDL